MRKIKQFGSNPNASSVISDTKLEELRRQYPIGTRVKLIEMNDQFNKVLHNGSLGTVTTVDDIGTIHVSWDEGSSLGVVYGVDRCVKV